MGDNNLADIHERCRGRLPKNLGKRLSKLPSQAIYELALFVELCQENAACSEWKRHEARITQHGKMLAALKLVDTNDASTLFAIGTDAADAIRKAVADAEAEAASKPAGE